LRCVALRCVALRCVALRCVRDHLSVTCRVCLSALTKVEGAVSESQVHCGVARKYYLFQVSLAMLLYRCRCRCCV
jgi:hypothetical protein